jgi:hypothetical protein
MIRLGRELKGNRLPFKPHEALTRLLLTHLDVVSAQLSLHGWDSCVRMVLDHRLICISVVVKRDMLADEFLS